MDQLNPRRRQVWKFVVGGVVLSALSAAAGYGRTWRPPLPAQAFGELIGHVLGGVILGWLIGYVWAISWKSPAATAAQHAGRLDGGSESPEDRFARRRAWIRLAFGGAIVVGCFAALPWFSGRSEVRQFLPLTLVVGAVVFGFGLHPVLWSGTLGASRITPGVRGVLTALATAGGIAALGAVLGAAVGFSHGLRHAGRPGWTDQERARFNQVCMDMLLKGEPDRSNTTAYGSYCACMGGFAEGRFPVFRDAVTVDPKHPDVAAAQKRCMAQMR